ncbi:hypothetical protein [Desertivirga arenae]|uniref:hypothetical protein n=1 Tax=Desertivirga arenae TaxID=2810309 RepID=UPI001A9604F3|nr:hypothetical protein [Pedobacter sp. SYSU D00823]
MFANQAEVHMKYYYKVFIGILFFLLTQVAFVKAQKALSLRAAIAAEEGALQRQDKQQRAEAEKEWKQGYVEAGPYKMKFDYKVYGLKPHDGRSLYISMHGGGGVPEAENDQQWKNQIKLYAPAEGVYFVPRSPTNSWNQWHQSHVDSLFAKVIRNAVIMEGVNPDKVYLLGYSAGGDGTYQIATRMADHFAAASAMAGHPGDARPENLYNLPFTIFMGGKDEAYNRNGLAEVWRRQLDSLRKDNPGGYIHKVTVYDDLGHWMKRKDTVALPWLAAYQRNALPKKVVWIQDDVDDKDFYWLAVPAGESKTGARAVVSIRNNVINIEENDHPNLIIMLNDRLINLNQKVLIKYQGKAIAKERIGRSKKIIEETAQRLDPSLIFSAGIYIENNVFKGQLK